MQILLIVKGARILKLVEIEIGQLSRGYDLNVSYGTQQAFFSRIDANGSVSVCEVGAG